MIELVSIVVPVYNVSDLLKRCLLSLTNQTYSNIEIILVDDGSTDNSLQICEEFARKDRRVKVLKQPNSGVSCARKNGFENSTGSFITFVDADDFLNDDFIEIAMQVALTDNLDLVLMPITRVFHNKSVYQKTILIPDKIYEGKNLKYLVLNPKYNISSVYSKLIRREIVDKLDFNTEINNGEIFYFSMQCFDAAKKVEYVSKSTYNYFLNNNSLTKTINEKSAYMLLNALIHLKNYILSDKQENIAFFYARAIDVVITCVISGFLRPGNNLSSKEKRQKYLSFVSNEFVTEILENVDLNKKSKIRKFIILQIKKRRFLFMKVIAFIRHTQYLLKSHF